ncbi:HD domain-containing protein [Roseibium hamelinense]|uniref:HD domain-containing protein n=1 Tax=Roseibium hamelinense TaxID=150831 RepID=A0A562TIR7_9HYPH|nr:HD domain-containing phosphohydrolase [Roseibium hamelinense]MTI42070.1 HD domain-containing protein [Roseibium hamelinense]TWI93323.1 HD domain-containing protein [Roseibium hamelinense]
MKNSKTGRHTLQFHLSVVFLVLVLSVGSAIGWLAYSRMNTVITEASHNLFDLTSTEAVAGLERLYAPAELAVEVIARQGITHARTLDERLVHLPVLAGFLDQAPSLSSLYVGYDDGDFVMLNKTSSETARRIFGAPGNSAYVIQSVEREPGMEAVGRFIFVDEAMTVIGQDTRPSFAEYDPRKRPWYKSAQAAVGQTKTDPYIFFTSRKLGQTIALNVPGTGATVAADIMLETLAASLRRERVTDHTELALFGSDLGMIAHPDETMVVEMLPPSATGGAPALGRLSANQLVGTVLPDVAKAAIAAGVTSGNGQTLTDRLTFDGATWRIQVSPLEIRGSDPYYLAIAVPEAELLAQARQLLQQGALAIGLILIVAVPITMLAARLISKPVRALSREAEKIKAFDFSDPVEVESAVIEIDDLSRSMNDMKSTIRQFLAINRAISDETDFARLLQTLLNSMGDIVGSSQGAVYLMSADETALEPAAAMGVPFETLARQPLDGLPNVLHEAVAREDVCTPRVTGEALAVCGGDPEDADNPERHAVVVPLFNRNDAMIGIMTLVSEEKGNPSLTRFVDALSRSAAIALETRQLIASQKALFQAFIRMIADAIDAKSPYTGGHCARVPELTKMLAEAAHDTDTGPFADLKLTEDDREAIHIAAWLHDCGKVTTPEYVVDKATKLETLYDRIHEIRMRFEVLKRDAWIAYWKGVADGGDGEALAKKRDLELETLDADFAFVAECNEGGEFMSDERIERLQDIAAKTWSRTLSDRVGISHEEATRKAAAPEPDLPVDEPLLADRREHILKRRPEDLFAPDNPWGFRLDQPEHLYNRGELYNLSVARGTLTPEERYKINDHIVQTIIMLSRLPFPHHLRQVPELAGGHHEKIDGSGHPKRLTGAEMTPVARMMAIADIFEALTAADRPYKKGKTLSEALKIMGFMVKDGHIDADLYDLFLTSGVWRDYAERFMKPEQIDEVDIDALRPKLSAAA